jgi:hypothetical protein
VASDHGGGKRRRSSRYPGVPLAEALDFVRVIDARGFSGLPTEELALALGIKNVRTNTFSARLSAARQFGLLKSQDEGFAPTLLARAILHPTDPLDVSRLLRQALVEPPLYASLAARYAGKVVPEAGVLANVLLHHEGITATAKDAAAANFLESARFVGALEGDGVLHLQHREASSPSTPSAAPPPRPAKSPSVRIDLRLRGRDEGKTVRLRSPESISEESLERLVQTIRLMVRVEP